jgi:hypothetical protein
VAIGRGAGEVEALVGELIGMRAQGRRVSGKSDDLVLAPSLAWWWVRRVYKGLTQCGSISACEYPRTPQGS